MKIYIQKSIWRQTLIIIAILVVGAVSYFFFAKKPAETLKLEKVARGDIVQEVSETGAVKPAQEIKMGFKTAGKIQKIDVSAGDIVEKGEELAAIETGQLYIQLNQAQAGLEIANAQYNKLLAGSTPEEIKISEDAKNLAQQNFDSAYHDALNVLDAAYLAIYNASAAVTTIKNTYFGLNDAESMRVQQSKTTIEASVVFSKSSLDKVKISPNKSDIDSAVLQILSDLNKTSDALRVARDQADSGVYYSRVASADKTILDTQKVSINTALDNATAAKQTISSDKITLQKAEDELTLKTAKPQQEDINLYKAKISEAQAQVYLLGDQIREAVLRSPIRGKIVRVEKKVGEIVQPNDFLISLISLDPLQIKVDVYEEDVVKIKEGDSADIKIIAFPNQALKGKVVSIDPAEKLVDGVVYYEVTISFDQLQEGIKPGMTADIAIKGQGKKGALIISKDAIRENGQITAEVFKNGKTERRQVQIGLQGNDNKIEIISGLTEGEEVVLR